MARYFSSSVIAGPRSLRGPTLEGPSRLPSSPLSPSASCSGTGSQYYYHLPRRTKIAQAECSEILPFLYELCLVLGSRLLTLTAVWTISVLLRGEGCFLYLCMASLLCLHHPSWLPLWESNAPAPSINIQVLRKSWILVSLRESSLGVFAARTRVFKGFSAACMSGGPVEVLICSLELLFYSTEFLNYHAAVVHVE